MRLSVCIGIKKLLISKKIKNPQLKFAKDHLYWTIKDWKKVAFSGQSKFILFGKDVQDNLYYILLAQEMTLVPNPISKTWWRKSDYFGNFLCTRSQSICRDQWKYECCYLQGYFRKQFVILY